MKPQSLVKYYKKNGLDLVADQVLQEVVLKHPVRVQQIVTSCLAKGISSQATTHKKLNDLTKVGLLSKQVDLYDNRVHILQVTEKGLLRLKKWGKR